MISKFKNTIRLAVFGTVLTTGLVGMAAAAAAEYQIDASHSDIIFKVRHMGISTVTGRFDQFAGSFTVDPKNLAATKGSATIEVSTINTNNAKRDGHLKAEDFFGADKFPQIKFTSKSVRSVNMADTTCELVGDLTIRDVTKEIVLKVKGTGIVNDPWGNERAGFSAKGTINRHDFGLKWNTLLETGGAVVAANVDIELAFEGVRPLAAAKPAAPAKAESKKK
jgi:polyisoprenoid-binding protein YceI